VVPVNVAPLRSAVTTGWEDPSIQLVEYAVTLAEYVSRTFQACADVVWLVRVICAWNLPGHVVLAGREYAPLTSPVGPVHPVELGEAVRDFVGGRVVGGCDTPVDDTPIRGLAVGRTVCSPAPGMLWPPAAMVGAPASGNCGNGTAGAALAALGELAGAFGECSG
jgi:hypothetical protein